MATFTAIKNRGGGRGALGGVLRYVQQEEKTTWEDRRLVSGWNCTAQSVCSEMQLTKERFHKTDGRQYYHFVQSFDKQDDLSPLEVHAIGLELAQREFPNFEVLVATHMDTEHLHNHLVVNSVSFQSGKKLHQSAADLQAHRIANDEICVAHGLEILPPPQKQVKQKRMSTREYRSAAKGESWKFRLMNTIDQCMRYAASKEEFISLMESEGYQVRWTDSRKSITYTTPTGMKCRDDRLHEEKYTKEVMEHEFRIRAAIAHGGIEAEERSAADTNPSLSQQRGVAGLHRLDELEQHTAAHTALLREVSSRREPCLTQSQMEALARDVAGIQALLRQAGKKKEFSISPPSLGTAMSVMVWLALILLGTMVGMVVLQTVWSGLAALWNAVKILIP